MHRVLAVASAALLAGCAASPPPSSSTRDLAALDAVTSSIIGHPITTTSDDARMHFLAAQREQDLGRNFEALDHYQRAVRADSTFAFAYLGVANVSNSLADFKTNLARAEKLASGASEAERIQIQIARRGFENDVSGQLALAQELVTKVPDSPRAYLILAGVQAGLNRTAEARESYGRRSRSRRISWRRTRRSASPTSSTSRATSARRWRTSSGPRRSRRMSPARTTSWAMRIAL